MSENEFQDIQKAHVIKIKSPNTTVKKFRKVNEFFGTRQTIKFAVRYQKKKYRYNECQK